ncbi:MAG: T9SS type A sorting domain-containing protein [Bacteroidetes bacterium]|nr:T9SS type A sorting domain-containing protein [Bacteroidota bacterium]
MVKRTIIFILISYFLVDMAVIGQTTYFNKIYDYNGLIDLGGTVLEIPGEGYFLIGASWDPFLDKDYRWIMKTDQYGDTIWLKEFGIPDTTYRYYYSGGDMQWTDDNNLIILETTYNKSLLDSKRCRITKMDTSANILWSNSFGFFTGRTTGVQLIKTEDKGYAVAGWWKASSITPPKVYLAKLDSMGNKMWDKVYGGSNNDASYSLVQTKDKGYLIAGYSYSFGAGDRDFFLVKTDSIGGQLWQKTYGNSGQDWGGRIYPALDGNYLLVGSKDTPSPGSKGWVMSVDDSGNVNWEKTYGDSIFGGFDQVLQLKDSTFIMKGGFYFLGEGITNGWLMKINNKGDSIWSRSYNQSGYNDYFYDFELTQDSGFIICGSVNREAGNTNTQEVWFIKLDSLGLCDSLYCYPDSDDTNINEVALDNKDKIKIYPNPFSTFTTIEILEGYKTGKKLSLTLYNLMGTEVKRIENISSNKFRINRDNLPSGLYFYRFADRDQTIATGKLAIQ